ncbi:uncharacterized protein LOC106644097 [Copidosoma floridanum]|uniref:uncharacterized protein LOC106644097 n=1 Tax=Copidosoma floridanum TaxID=29053 RepID=UPI0006C99257|nr:uncharacterized protein LOC106644097 [Copidosoma floridanum]XP_014215064.1 uncharacterized protein LOC106644097 [Copidosoma floridanum]
MSPEPNQESVDDLNTVQLNGAITRMPETDSEDEDTGMSAGYMPLSQIPVEGEPLDDEDDEDDFGWSSAPMEAEPNVLVPNDHSDVDPETLEVWASTSNATNIDMDADKISQVKSAMASFTLPSTAIPEWANTISEDRWKEQLIHRIKEIQKDKK